MTTWIWIVLGVGVLILLIALVVLVARRSRRVAARHEHSHDLKEQFGPEYELLVAEHGRRDGEAALEQRLDVYETLEIQSLPPASRDDHTEKWKDIQFHFIDSPEGAVREAEHLVVTVMAERGYPTADHASRVDAISLGEPQLAADYRVAHATFRRADVGNATVEQLFDGVRIYRRILEALLGRAQREATTFDADAPAIGSDTNTADTGSRELPSNPTAESTPARP